MYNEKKFGKGVTVVSVEYEWKFDAAPSVLTAIDQAFSGDRQIFKMETVYYDTPSGALSARLDLGKGPGPLMHNFDRTSPFAKEKHLSERSQKK